MLRFEINYEITYDIENQAVLLEVESNAQLLEINNYFKQQLQEFNETNMLFNFVDKGLYLDFYLYRNLSRYLLKETKSCQKQSKEQ